MLTSLGYPMLQPTKRRQRLIPPRLEPQSKASPATVRGLPRLWFAEGGEVPTGRHLFDVPRVSEIAWWDRLRKGKCFRQQHPRARQGRGGSESTSGRSMQEKRNRTHFDNADDASIECRKVAIFGILRSSRDARSSSGDSITEATATDDDYITAHSISVEYQRG